MKNLSIRFAPSLLAFAVGATGGIALIDAAQAQSAAAPAAGTTAAMPQMQPHSPGGHEPQAHGGRMTREVERLRNSLKLSPGQAALWDRALQQARPPTDLRDRMKGRHDRMAAMLDDPDFDPRKLAADMDGAEAERHSQMTAMRDAWFAVYDALNPVQRGQAREFLRSHMGHHGGRGPDGHRMGEGRHGMQKDGADAGAAPMQSPPR